MKFNRRSAWNTVRQLRRSLSLLTLLAMLGAGAAWAQIPGVFIRTNSDMTTYRIGHTATLLQNGKVLITGGASEYGPDRNLPPPNAAELYDPSTGRFTLTGNMATARRGHTATLLPDGRVLIAGGAYRFSDEMAASAEIYDPSTGTFYPVADMTSVRIGASATLLASGKVLIAGGGYVDPILLRASGLNRSAELFDPATWTFTPTGNMGTAQRSHSATLLPNGKVLVAGGNVGGDFAWLEIAAPEIYDPSTGTFAPLGDTVTRDIGHRRASLLPNGTVLLPGGNTNTGPSGKAELFDPTTQIFSPLGDMISARGQHSTTVLTDGTVLIAGYSASGGNAEVYDPATSTFYPTGSMNLSRHLHAATLLLDGTVLLTGGSGFFPSPEATAEIYIPPPRTPAPLLFTVLFGSTNVPSQGAILHANSARFASPGDPAVEGEALEIYLTGLMEGSLIPPQAAIGGRMAEVLFFGNAPGFAGLNQVNVRVPSGVAPGDAVPVRLTYIGRSSNEVTIAVQ